ncbi:hypothetical protein Tsubulata_043158 [Turnera subulata]|uniref:DUF3741 domain-containing protein n=1 Tax=Turnera subulata TaxID=218843 RepID=A0A9Q0FZU6_9ROSI|nr:hypothetical protein Tsubulata_043158 [Turnera subulata]
MAKRSDFAQKLLDDLRLRKERMAASQSSKASNSTAGDAYALTKQSYRGSRETHSNQTYGFRSGNAHSRSNKDSKSLSIREKSKDIVPFGKGRSSEQIGDLSMALNFAIENGGKLVRMDSSGSGSVLGFLNQFSRRATELGKMERSRNFNRPYPSNGQYPAVSHLHLKEIAKGAEKLNQILRACSDGLNFGTYSIKIGSELLKGAMDLEESLRMLVNLQEASDHMVTPKSKTRITLLDADEDEEENSALTFENKQLDRPRFSFDKPNRNSHYSQELSRSEFNQRLMALAYLSEAANLHHNTHGTSTTTSVSHKRSTSHGSNLKSVPESSRHRSTSSSTKFNAEKGRIPNVIAKLMGLEEPPEEKDSKSITRRDVPPEKKISKSTTQKELSSIQKHKGMVTENHIEGNSSRERKAKDVENLLPSARKQRQMQPHQVQVIKDSTLQAEKNPGSRKVGSSFEVTIPNGEPPGKDVEGRKLMRNSNRTSAKIDSNQTNTVQLTQSTRSRHDILDKERKQNTIKTREHYGKEKSYPKELELKNELLQMAPPTEHESKSATTWQWQTEHDTSMLKKMDLNRIPSTIQAKSRNDLGFQQPYAPRNLEPRDMVGKEKGSEVVARSSSKLKHGTMNLQKRQSHASHETSAKKSHMETIHGLQSKEFQNSRYHENSVQNISMQDSMNRNSGLDSSHMEQKSDVRDRTSIRTVMEEKHVHLQHIQKANTTKQKVSSSRKIDELAARRSGASDSFAKSPKHKTSILKEVKKKRQDQPSGSVEAEKNRGIRSKEAEARIVKSSKPIARIQKPKVVQEAQVEADQTPNLLSPPVDDQCQSLEETENLDSNDRLQSQSTIPMVTNDQQGQQLDVDEGRSQTILDTTDGTLRDSKDIAYSSQEELAMRPPEPEPEPLTESESCLRKILIKSQLFLNTSEALFRLNTPYDILNSGGHDNQEEESKLTLDCGYEIMKRRGKKQELSTHPFMRVSVTSPKISSLDDLIRQLHKDFETLKLYGRNGNAECLVEDYLPRMLENDVHNRYSDVDCMWDIGWDEIKGSLPEKDEVVRDVERFVLNALLDEVTRELVHAF